MTASSRFPSRHRDASLSSVPARSSARQPASVTCLGTGDGRPCADRNHSSYLYELGGRVVLIDCGEPAARSLAAIGFDWNRLDAIVLSHTHADHVGGLLMLLQGMWLEGRSRDLVVHLPGHVIEPFRQLIRHAYLFDELFGFELRFEPLKEGCPMNLGRVKLLPFRNSHLDSLERAFGGRHRRVAFESFSFLIEGAGRRIVHSGDLGAPEDLLPLLERPVDLLVCELAHFEPRELFSCLQGRDPAWLACIHVARDVRRRMPAVRREAKRLLPRTVCCFPKDGEVLRLPAGGQSGAR